MRGRRECVYFIISPEPHFALFWPTGSWDGIISSYVDKPRTMERTSDPLAASSFRKPEHGRCMFGTCGPYVFAQAFIGEEPRFFPRRAKYVSSIYRDRTIVNGFAPNLTMNSWHISYGVPSTYLNCSVRRVKHFAVRYHEILFHHIRRITQRLRLVFYYKCIFMRIPLIAIAHKFEWDPPRFLRLIQQSLGISHLMPKKSCGKATGQS